MPVPRLAPEPSSWASSSSAAVRTGERRGVWAAEEERLGAACVRACVRACGVNMGPIRVMCVCGLQKQSKEGQGVSEVGMRKRRDVREAAGRVRGGALTP